MFSCFTMFILSDGKLTPVNGESGLFDAAAVDRNNNEDLITLNPPEDVKKLPQPVSSSSEPTSSRVVSADRQAVSVSVDVEGDRRRSWVSGKKAIWASFSNDDDELQKYRIISKSDSASTEELDAPITPSRSTAPSLLARSFSSVSNYTLFEINQSFVPQVTAAARVSPAELIGRYQTVIKVTRCRSV